MPRTSKPERAPQRGAARIARRQLTTSPARRRVAAVAALVAGAVLWGSPVHAVVKPPVAGGGAAAEPHATAPETLPTFASPRAQVRGHLLDLAPSARAVSPWIATDLTSLESAASVTGAVAAAQAPSGVLVVAARTTTGHVDVLHLRPRRPGLGGERRHRPRDRADRRGLAGGGRRPVRRHARLLPDRGGRPRRGRERPQDGGPLVRLGPHRPRRRRRAARRSRATRWCSPCPGSRPRSTRGRRPGRWSPSRSPRTPRSPGTTSTSPRSPRAPRSWAPPRSSPHPTGSA